MITPPLLRLERVAVSYPARQYRGAAVKAAREVSLSLDEGQTLGLVGESGCGKSTLAKAICRLVSLSAGQIFFQGEDISRYNRRQERLFRQATQLVLQDPDASLNPRRRVGEILREPLRVHKIVPREQEEQEVDRLLTQIGLSADGKKRYPFAFSGGQRQRISIARALSVRPRLLICDEPVSSLDAFVQAGILRLLKTLQEERGFAVLLIAHGLNVVRYLADRLAVMYAGRIIEYGDTEDIFRQPGHPYTRALLDAQPVSSPARRRERPLLAVPGEDEATGDRGCAFFPRCPQARPFCQENVPPAPTGTERAVACFYPPA
ncbi:MAG: ABC transporter ATP-binding protein [Peptococcaceae bacterium]|jgi:peptide/nickel transport system ATP-binding protein/oligopeptide transport system ATP-binding protein|nr:ABC transporter ATP-binding protein [Peptococcaceae bacterium]